LEILDNTNLILTIIVGSGLTAAIPRFVNLKQTKFEKNAVVSTAAAFVSSVGAVICLIGLLNSKRIAVGLLGSSEYSSLIALSIITMYAQLIFLVISTAFIASKRSKAYLSYSILKLAIGIGINLFCLIIAGMGVRAMVYGNLIATSVVTIAMTAHFFYEENLAFDIDALWSMLRFGIPLIPATLLATIMHNGDRYLIRFVNSLEDVGMYSLGYKFPYLLNAFVMQSFSYIWNASMYDIAKQPDASYQFARVTTYSMGIFLFAQLALSIFSSEIVMLLADHKFFLAHRIIPFVALGLSFHAFYFFFSVGSFVNGKTWALNIAYFPAVAINIVSNIILLPKLGYMTAAWVSVVTYFVFALILYFISRKQMKISFEFGRLFTLFLLAGTIFFISRVIQFPNVFFHVLAHVLLLLSFPAGLFLCGFFTKGELGFLRVLAERLGAVTGFAKLRQKLQPVRIIVIAASRAAEYIATTQKRFFQFKNFWKAVAAGHEKQLSMRKEHPHLHETVHDIRNWLDSLFPEMGGGLNLISAEKYPYSEIYLFSRNRGEDGPTRIAVKRFVSDRDDEIQGEVASMRRECEALFQAREVKGTDNIGTPELLAYNEELTVMAMKWLDGSRYVNTLLDYPFKPVLGRLRLSAHGKILNNLGYWLKTLHALPAASLSDEEQRTILERDLAHMGVRLAHLEEYRPADFPHAVCERILSKVSNLMRKGLLVRQSPCPTHGDLSLANILSHDGKLTVLDFATFGTGFAQDDLARLYLDLYNADHYTFIFLPRNRGIWAESFFEGYGRSLDPAANPLDAFHLIKHSLINVSMYTIQWGKKRFLNPFLCRWLYGVQRRFLLNQIRD
jgi:O-antigen/teichoic acid export membrane protein/aminoglycoside phosphotransferase (APT) family kinase protein